MGQSLYLLCNGLVSQPSLLHIPQVFLQARGLSPDFTLTDQHVSYLIQNMEPSGVP